MMLVYTITQEILTITISYSPGWQALDTLLSPQFAHTMPPLPDQFNLKS